jgi:ABC-2 type transport system permease protein
VLGPFLIMAVFGLGYQGYRQPLDTVIVVPPQTGIPQDLGTFQQVTPGMNIVRVAPESEEALQELRDRKLDVVIVAPENMEQQFRAGQQSVIQVHINVVDPVQEAYAGVLAAQMAAKVNQEIIKTAAGEGQSYAVAAGEEEAAEIPPDVIAEPTRADLLNEAPLEPNVISFFGPAALALILQHLGVTLIALSVVRERTTGIIELFRISPISPIEVILGKVLAFGVLATAVSTATVALLVLGFLIAIVSDSERQAVQISLLVLLASVFFSGFVLPIEEFTAPVRTIGYMLPVTHGIRLAQDLMLRGWTDATWQIGALAAIALVLLVLSWLLFRRNMVRA